MDDYAARIRRFAEVEFTELREDSAASLRKFVIEPGAAVVLLDDAGKGIRNRALPLVFRLPARRKLGRALGV